MTSGGGLVRGSARMTAARITAMLALVALGMTPAAGAAAATAAATATTKSAATPGSVGTSLAFEADSLSQQATDFSGFTVTADFTAHPTNGSTSTPIDESSSCGTTSGYITFTVSLSGGSTHTANACATNGTATYSLPDSLRAAALGTKYSVKAAFHPTSTTRYKASSTTKSATVTIATTPVLATAVVDYDPDSPTRAVIYGNLRSPGSGGDYEKIPTGTWKLVLSAADGSKTFVLLRKTEPAGLSPQWSVTGLTAGTKYSALATFAYPSSDAGRHTVKSDAASTFTTAGDAPSATPTPSAEPSVAPAPVDTATPAPSSTATTAPAPVATATPVAKTGFPDTVLGAIPALKAMSPLERVGIVLAAVVVLALLGLIIGIAVYRHRNA